MIRLMYTLNPRLGDDFIRIKFRLIYNASKRNFEIPREEKQF